MQQIFECAALPDEVGLPFQHQYFGRFLPGVKVTAHLIAVGSCIMKYKIVSFANLIQWSVPGKRIGLTNIAYNGINTLRTIRVGNIADSVISLVKHRSY